MNLRWQMDNIIKIVVFFFIYFQVIRWFWVAIEVCVPHLVDFCPDELNKNILKKNGTYTFWENIGVNEAS